MERRSGAKDTKQGIVVSLLVHFCGKMTYTDFTAHLVCPASWARLVALVKCGLALNGTPQKRRQISANTAFHSSERLPSSMTSIRGPSMIPSILKKKTDLLRLGNRTMVKFSSSAIVTEEIAYASLAHVSPIVTNAAIMSQNPNRVSS